MKNNTSLALFVVLLLMIVLLFTSFAYGKSREDNTREAILGHEEKQLYNFLLLGRDSAAGLCDVIILTSVNVSDGNVNIMQIPRDTYFNYADGSYKKINGAANALGISGFVSALGDALGIGIDYYLSLDTKTVAKMVDMLSGIEIDVPSDMDYDDPAQGLSIHIKKGKQKLGGEEAVNFLRYRSGYLTGDIGRIDAQKLFLNAFVKRVGEQKNPLVYLNLFKLVSTNGVTNIREQDITSIGLKCSKTSAGKVYYVTAPGSAVQSENSGAWYYVLSKSSMQELLGERFGLKDGKKDFDNTQKFVDNKIKSFYDIYNKRSEYRVFTADELENEQININ